MTQGILNPLCVVFVAIFVAIQSPVPKLWPTMKPKGLLPCALNHRI